MELNYINEFLVLSNVLQFQEAADQLFISESSLSKHIRSLEQELGHDLFVRSKKGVALTEFGASWIPYATQIVDAQKSYIRDLLTADADSSICSIGYIPLVTLYKFLPFFSEFKKTHPNYQYSLMQGTEKELYEWLQQKKVDFILTGSSDFPGELYQKFCYTRDTLCVVMSEDHPLAANEKVSLKQIEGEPLIDFSHTASLSQTVQNADPGHTFLPAIRVDKMDILMDLVRSKMGIAIMTSHLAKHSRQKGVVARKLTPDIYYEINLVWPSRKAKTIAKEFAGYLQKQ